MAGETVRETEGRFNPAVPDIHPDLRPERMLSFAKSISQPQSPKEGEYLFSGLGHLIGEAAHGLDTAQKLGLDEEVRTGVEKIRSARIAELEESKNLLGTATTTGTVAPDEVKKVGDRLQTLKDARANGHISQTQYDGQLRAFLSGVRARNPGYTKYIDEEGKRIIGYDPANQQMTQLIQDMNAMVSSKNDERKWIQQQIAEHYASEPWARNLAEAVAGGKAGMGDFISLKANVDRLKAKYQQFEYAEKMDKFEAGNQTDELVTEMGNKFMHDTISAGSTFTPAQVLQNMEDYNKTGSTKYSKEQWSQMGMSMELMYQRAQQEAQKLGASQVTLPNGTKATRINILGQSDYDARVKQALLPMRSIIDDIKNQDFGPAYLKQRIVNDILQNKTSELYQRKDIGPAMAAIDVLNQRAKELVPEVVKQFFGNKNANSALNDFVGIEGIKLITDPSASAVSTAEAFRKAGITAGASYREIVDKINLIKTPGVAADMKQSIIEAFVKPGNGALLETLKRDNIITTATGEKRRVPAAFNDYFTLTDPQITAEVAKMPANVRGAYKDRAGEWLGTLFTTDALTIQDYPKAIEWDSTNHRFKPIPAKGTPAGPDFSQVNLSINRLNQALMNYKQVIKSTTPEADVNVEILHQLEAMGITPNTPKESGLKKVWDAIVTSLKKPGVKGIEEE
jgi:hypothetical protein